MATSLRASRGCRPCRRRRVKCDEGRPACERCIKRGEICEGYRDDSVLVFRDENEKTSRRFLRRRMSTQDLSSRASGARYSVRHSSIKPTAVSNHLEMAELDKPGTVTHNRYPWLKTSALATAPTEDEQAVSFFFERYVMYPCNHSSSPGFLEHLPYLFEEVKHERRLALRWAVRAAGYASLAVEQDSNELRYKAQQCYGSALSALAESLTDPRSSSNDLTLMTILLLDMFEGIFLPASESRGSHVDGMAQILRLRGHKQFYNTRGWSLFRLAHHRLQRQQLAFRREPLPESQAWIESLNDDLSEVRTENENLQISQICARAREVRAKIGQLDMPHDQVLELIREMHSLDQTVSNWRSGPGWAFKTIKVSELALEEDKMPNYPDFVQLHHDVWIAYEWNYHRTARIILHEHLLECLVRLTECSSMSGAVSDRVKSFKNMSIDIIIRLIDAVLSTTPQSLGDIDNNGMPLQDSFGYSMCTGAGAYFLLWPIRVIKATRSVTAQQRKTAENIFERIRDCTGVKSALGDSSKV